MSLMLNRKQNPSAPIHTSPLDILAGTLGAVAAVGLLTWLGGVSPGLGAFLHRMGRLVSMIFVFPMVLGAVQLKRKLLPLRRKPRREVPGLGVIYLICSIAGTLALVMAVFAALGSPAEWGYEESRWQWIWRRSSVPFGVGVGLLSLALLIDELALTDRPAMRAAKSEQPPANDP